MKSPWNAALAMVAGLGLLILCLSLGAQEQTVPKFKFDPDWPKPLPNKWKMGGVTGLAVDKDDNVWVLDRPNDLTDIELEAELTPPLADCCVRPPSMIHIDKNGSVIGSFDAPRNQSPRRPRSDGKPRHRSRLRSTFHLGLCRVCLGRA